MLRFLEIYNYKSIRRAQVDLSRFNVLVGKNGTGKSNFIDSLSFLSDALQKSLEHAVGKRGGYLAICTSTPGGRPTEITITTMLVFRDAKEKPRFVAEYTIAIKNDQEKGVKCKREFCVIHEHEERIAEFTNEGGKSIRLMYKNMGIPPKLAFDGSLALPFLANYVPEFREVYDYLRNIRAYAINPGKMAAFQDISSEDMLSDGGNAASVMYELQQKHPKKHKYICKLLKVVVPDIANVDVLSRGSQRGLRFHQNFGKRDIAYLGGNISDGTLRVLGLLLAIHQSRRPSLLVIEEPEATVHPGVLDIILQELLSESHNHQVMISTHSPEVLDYKEIAPSDILTFEKYDGVTVVSKISREQLDMVRKSLLTTGDLLRYGQLKSEVLESGALEDAIGSREPKDKDKKRQGRLDEYFK